MKPESVAEERFSVPRDGLLLAGDIIGPASGPAVLLLHGGGQTRHSWRGTADRLAAAGYRCHLLDLRGHGESSWAGDGDYSLEAFVADVVGVVAAIGQPTALVGASLGGLAALGAAGAPGVAAIVLVDIATRLEEEGVMRIRDFMRAAPDGFASLEEAAGSIGRYRGSEAASASASASGSGLAKILRQGADGRWRWHWDPRFLDGISSGAAPRNRDHLDEWARRVSIPTLLVRGRSSDVLSSAGARHFLDLVAHAQYVDVTGAGHMVVGDRNDAFTEAVEAFLSGVVGSGPAVSDVGTTGR